MPRYEYGVYGKSCLFRASLGSKEATPFAVQVQNRANGFGLHEVQLELEVPLPEVSLL